MRIDVIEIPNSVGSSKLEMAVHQPTAKFQITNGNSQILTRLLLYIGKSVQNLGRVCDRDVYFAGDNRA